LRGRLDGRRILVTGAGSGIGRAIAIEASKRGADLCLCGRRVQALQDTYALLSSSGNHLVVPADITCDKARSRLAGHIGASWGALDLLVNNAGIISAGRLEATSPETIAEMLATNIAAPILLTREVMPLLVMGRSPRIVNIGSMLGEIPFANFAAYSASKAAIKGFSTAMRRELMVKNIDVTYVAPRTTATDAAAKLSDVTTGRTVDSPERVACQIWNAVDRNRDHVFPSFMERLFMVLQAMAPRVVDRAVTPLRPVAPPMATSFKDTRSKEASHAQF
jgi:short-subunit dehydrogenase